MAAQRDIALAGLHQAASRVIAHGLEEPEASLGRTRIGEDQRLLDETTKEVERIQEVDGIARTNGLGGFQRGASSKHGQPAQDGPLLLGQQVVAPVDRRPERLVAGDGCSASTGQQSEPVVETSGDLLDRERPNAGCGELDGQRDSVEPAAQLGDRRGVGVGQIERRLDGPSSFHEQPAGVHGAQGGGTDGWPRFGRRQRGDRQDRLARHAQGLAAGHQHSHTRARLQH